MVREDLKEAERDQLCQREGFQTFNQFEWRAEAIDDWRLYLTQRRRWSQRKDFVGIKRNKNSVRSESQVRETNGREDRDQRSKGMERRAESKTILGMFLKPVICRHRLSSSSAISKSSSAIWIENCQILKSWNLNFAIVTVPFCSVFCFLPYALCPMPYAPCKITYIINWTNATGHSNA